MTHRRRRVGIMGGTFNPVHFAHLILAENAYHAYKLDEILMMPNGVPPHKMGQHIIPAKDRLEMLRLAIEGISYFRLSDYELKREGLIYSSDTLTYLRLEHPDTDYYFIMGADSIFQIETWHEPEVVMNNCTILAAVRNHVSKERLRNQIKTLEQKYGADIRPLDIPDLTLSSSDIRRRVAKGESIRFMVPDAVCDYICQHHLYDQAD